MSSWRQRLASAQSSALMSVFSCIACDMDTITNVRLLAFRLLRGHWTKSREQGPRLEISGDRTHTHFTAMPRQEHPAPQCMP